MQQWGAVVVRERASVKWFARMASPGDLIGSGDGWSLVCSVEALAANSILGLAGAVKGGKRAVGSVPQSYRELGLKA